MTSICNPKECTGCGACVSICPKGAIFFVEKTTGHFIPSIDEDKCVDCHLCEKKCPQNNEISFVKPQTVYAAWRKDANAQLGSSSGGVAAALYEMAIEKGMYIVGTILDDKYCPKLVITNKREDIELFKGSKYVQASTINVYREVKQLINNGNKVLFIGSPCQCSAAKSVLNERELEGLYTVELICHGVPSQKLWKDYYTWISNSKQRNIKNVSFRTKFGEELTMIDTDGKTFWKRKVKEDYYLKAFGEGYSINNACFNCRYAKTERSNDLTIGDFWGIGKIIPFNNPGRKVSLIFVNSKRGKDIISNIDSLELKERTLDEAIAENTQLRHPVIRNKKYDIFWNAYDNGGIERAFELTLKSEADILFYKNHIKESIKGIIKTVIGRKE